jgi:restriction system protein
MQLTADTHAAMSETSIWGIHGGAMGRADALFLKKNRIALGWSDLGNLTSYKGDRNVLKSEIVKKYPGKPPGAVRNTAGQLLRFVHEMKSGDLVVYPSKQDRFIHIGRVEGEYEYHPQIDPEYPHQRTVVWLKHLPRTDFSQGALYEAGSALSFFKIKNYAHEFRAAAEGKASPPPVAEDESVAAVAADIEETTRDFVVKRLLQQLKGLPFEEFIMHLLETMGYKARLAERNEPSVDIIAHKDVLGIEPPIIKVQVKSSEGVASDKDVSALSGKLSSTEYGLFVTLGSFSADSRRFAQGKANLRLIDGQELVNLIFEHYDHFNSRYKGILPLRRVYVPEVVEDAV